jgi:Fic-DOC domain mobile mystery protein B
VPGWNELPGETPIDASGLKMKGIASRAELNRAEADNIRKVFVKYLASKPTARTAPFHLSWICRLHKEMFGDVWKWAGKPRKEDLNIGIPWQQIETQLQILLDDLACWSRYGVVLLDQAVRLHHRAVSIHPFPNGNGRWSRMLANIWLKRHAHPLTEWPEETIGATSAIRNEYIAAIKLADEGNLDAHLELHRRFTAT